MNLVDTHCHLDFYQFESDRQDVLMAAWETGLTRILVPGIDIATSQAALRLAQSHPNLYAAVGIHPNSSNSWDAWTEESLEMLSSHGKVVAIGEIGLDYYRDRALREHQKSIFRQQLALANQKKLPVVIHVRNANENDRSCIHDILEILAGWGPGRQLPGVIHSYSGNIDEANRLIEMGFFLGITGPVTYPKAEALREVVAAVPLDRLLIETDSPFLSPQPRRGRRNEPAFVRYVAEKIAAIRAQPLEVVANQVCLNAARLFGWEESSSATP